MKKKFVHVVKIELRKGNNLLIGNIMLLKKTKEALILKKAVEKVAKGVEKKSSIQVTCSIANMEILETPSDVKGAIREAMLQIMTQAVKSPEIKTKKDEAGRKVPEDSKRKAERAR